ncbi:MAG TPA: hypothetical protein VOA88_01070 [Candidatus Dormibacteraeota bacterium]|nr:hypothetical protein [Candidatus Dormibacteraeota bacterium]
MQVEKNNKPSTDGTEVAVPAPTQLVAVDPRILNLLMEDKVEAAAERKRQREIAEKRNKARQENSQHSDKMLVEAVRKCCLRGHLKGGKFRKKNAARDVAFSLHTFIGGEQRVKCLLCPFVVWGPRQGGKVAADSRETIWVDNGDGFRSQPNPSYWPERGLPGLGFAEARKLMEDESTNIETKSETVFTNPQIVSNQLQKENEELKAQLEALKKGKE